MKSHSNKFKYKHSLGQNFIIDEFLLDDIVDLSGINSNDYVLEIGPGNGALTKSLCVKGKHIISVEIDKSLMPLLNSNLKDYSNVTIVNADYLNYDFNNIIKTFNTFGYDESKNHIKVVANLPYYITSPIINSLLLNVHISEMTIMVQKEVAERIVAKPNSRDYGILTLATEYFAKTSLLMIVSKNCFYPMPKVDSAVVKFIKNDDIIDLTNESNYKISENPDYKKLFSLIKSSFSQRRKKLINSITNTTNIDKTVLLETFHQLGFDENTRAENLSLDDYKNLLEKIYLFI